MVMMVIVMGGIITGLSMGLRLYGRAEANGKVTNGARFTAASFKHKIWPMMSRASIVEILPNLPDTAVSDSEDCYVYLDESEQCVKYRIGDRDEPLPGSEFITSLDFSVPTASEDRAENFILRMRVEAQAPRVKSAHVTLDIDSALINRPAKRGPAREAAYGGPVLHFNIFDFRELNQYTPPGDSRPLKNDETVKKNSVIQLRYDITVPSGRRDATKILYYASTESKASLPKSAGYWEDTQYETPPYTDKNKGDYCWPLLITSGDEYYLAGDQYKKASGKEDEFLKIPTSGEFHVYTGSNFDGNNSDSDFEDDGKLKDTVKGEAKPFGKYGFLRAWVVPAYSDADGGGFVRPKGYEQWSVRVKIQPSRMPAENFWIEAVNSMVNPDTDPYPDQHWRPDNETTATGIMDTEEGTYEVEVTMPSAAAHKLSQTALLAKAVKPEHLKDARRYDAASQTGGVSYTGITNYSYIVDATMKDNVGGLAVILNGYRDENNNEGVNGFMFAYDPGACGIKMFLMNPAGNVGTPSLSNFDYWGSEEQHRPGYIYSSWGETKLYTYWDSSIYRIRTQHRLEALMNPGALNQKYSGISNTEASTGNNGNIKNFMYNGNGKTRRRFIVTLLEYYTNNEEYPRLLVRVRLLKNISDVKSETGKSEEQLREEDPFLIGPKFYLSEPAWYGSFVGQKPDLSVKNKVRTFSFRSLFYGGGSGGNSFSFDRLDKQTVYDLTENGMQQSLCTYEENPVYYAVKNTANDVQNNNNKLYSNFGGVFKHAELNAREALESKNYSYKTDNGRKSPSTSGYKLGSTKPNRMHWFGLSVWPDNWNKKVSLTVHDITLGPGFSKDELLAIVENGAKLFGMDETCNKNFSLANCEYETGRDGGSAWTKRVFGNAGGQSDAARSGSSYENRFKDANEQKQTCVMSLQHTTHYSSSSNNDGCPICDAYNKYNSDPTKRISDWGY